MTGAHCKVCGRSLKSADSIRRGVGPSCAKHYPPAHLAEHASESIRKQADDIYATARAAIREMRSEPNPYLSLYLAHLAIEKMLKCVIWSRDKRFEHGHDLVTLFRRALSDESTPDWIREFAQKLNAFQTAAKYPVEMDIIISRTDRDFIESALSKMEEVLVWLSNKMI